MDLSCRETDGVAAVGMFPGLRCVAGLGMRGSRSLRGVQSRRTYLHVDYSLVNCAQRSLQSNSQQKSRHGSTPKFERRCGRGQLKRSPTNILQSWQQRMDTDLTGRTWQACSRRCTWVRLSRAV